MSADYKHIGNVSSVKDNILYCANKESISYIGEVVHFYNRDEAFVEQDLICEGCIFEASEEYFKILLIQGNQQRICVGDKVFATSKTIRIKLGFHILGKTINPFGRVLSNHVVSFKSTGEIYRYGPVDNFLETLFETEFRYISNRSPSIIDRKKVSKPLLTGINSIDCLFPIGLGQRQLIIGDNNTGKTSLALSVILNQSTYNNFSKKRYKKYSKLHSFKPCIYVSIGQKRSEIIRIHKILVWHKSDWYTSIIFTSSDNLPIIQYYAPYTGCVMGEWFMENGYDCILVFDDLSKHSVAYRQITLLLRRPPGREAYPGDVFFLHSRLLERSAQLASNKGEGTLTALPIIETLCGDVSSYIPTNVISITDGQIFLNKELLNRGVLPAVDLNLSVSRVGSSSQYKLMVTLSKVIKQQLSLYRQFKDAELLGGGNETIKVYVNRGKRLILFFTQPLFSTTSYIKQIVYFYCLAEGFADHIDLKITKFFLASIFNFNYYTHFTDDVKATFLDFFRDLSFCEENFKLIKLYFVRRELYELLHNFTIFFRTTVVPIISGYKDADYMWSIISKYNDSF